MIVKVILAIFTGASAQRCHAPLFPLGSDTRCWAEAPIKIARMTLTIKLDRNWSSFQLANSAPPLSVTDSAIAPSARMLCHAAFRPCRWCRGRGVCFHGVLCDISYMWLRLACGCVRFRACSRVLCFIVGARGPPKNSGSHIDASHSRQPLVKGERLVRYEVNAVMRSCASHLLCQVGCAHAVCLPPQFCPHLCYLDDSARRRSGVLVIGAIAISLGVAVLG